MADRQAQIEDTWERYEQAMKALQPIFRAWREGVLGLGVALVEALRPMLQAILEWWIAYRREAFYQKLCGWHVPRLVARFVADHWPARWLPAPALED